MNPPSAQPDVQSQPAVDVVIDIAFAQSTRRETTHELLWELRQSPTDLAKLVRRVDQRRRGVVPVSVHAITRWNKDDPTSWERVRDWLTTRGVRIIET